MYTVRLIIKYFSDFNIKNIFMKKLIYMCLAVCMFTSIATAQKVTQKDLQGTWKMTNFIGGGLIVDVPLNKISLNPEIESQLTPEQKKQFNDEMSLAMEMFKESYTYIDGNNMRQTMGGKEQKGTFTIKEQGGKQYLVLSEGEGAPAEDIHVSVKDKKLYLTQGEENEKVEFVYMKQ